MSSSDSDDYHINYPGKGVIRVKSSSQDSEPEESLLEDNTVITIDEQLDKLNDSISYNDVEIIKDLKNAIIDGDIEKYNKIRNQKDYMDYGVYCNMVIEAAKHNKIEFIEMFSESGIDKLTAGVVSEIVAEKGYEELIEYMLNYERFNAIAFGAAKAGNLELVKRAVKRGADAYNVILFYASESNRLDIVKYAIELGASDYGAALQNSAKHKDMKIFNYILDNYDDGTEDYTNEIISGIADSGDYDRFSNYLDTINDKSSIDWSSVGVSACFSGSTKILDIVFSYKSENLPLNEMVEASEKHPQIVQYLIDKTGDESLRQYVFWDD